MTVPTSPDAATVVDIPADAAAAATAPWPRRVAVIAEKNPFPERHGAAESLHHLTDMLQRGGARLSLICMQRIEQGRRRFHMVGAMTDVFEQVSFPGTLRVGEHFYVIRPDRWVPPLRRPPASETGLWDFPPLGAGRARSAARLAAAFGADLVIADYFNAAGAFAHLPPGVATAIYTHDLLALRAQSARKAGLPLDFDPAHLEREAAAFRSADICFMHKAEEADHVRGVNPDCLCLETPYSRPMPTLSLVPPERPQVLFVGSVNQPNVDGLNWLLQDVWPLVRAARRDATLRVVGRICAHADHWPEGATPAGFVDDLAAEYAGASVALTPLRFGSGLKIKLVEALAHGVPCVATAAGASGAPPAPEPCLRVADSAQGFADAVLATLGYSQPEAARRAAAAYAAAHFARDAAARRLSAQLAGFHATRMTA